MIISGIIEYLNNGMILVNFICHLVIFLGGFYIALHSRIMPTWAVTSLWYIGVSSFLALLTIIFDWIKGPEFEFSYTMLGRVAETLLHVNMAIMVGMLFFHTIYKDYKGMKRRRTDHIDTI